jgi:hypothetical protein
VSDEWWFGMWILVVVVGAEGRSGASEMGHRIGKAWREQNPWFKSPLVVFLFAVMFASSGTVVLLCKNVDKEMVFCARHVVILLRQWN